MKVSGEVTQIINVADIGEYSILENEEKLKEYNKDWVCLDNLDRLRGIKFILNLFKKDKPVRFFNILMDSDNIYKGDNLELDIEPIKDLPGFYLLTDKK
jgi:hypothetical protein